MGMRFTDTWTTLNGSRVGRQGHTALPVGTNDPTDDLLVRAAYCGPVTPDLEQEYSPSSRVGGSSEPFVADYALRSAAAAAALGVRTQREYELLAACVRAKPRDVLAYQDAVWAWQRETGRAASARLRSPVDTDPKRLVQPRVGQRRSVMP